MVGQREEISLRVLKNISGVSAPFELLQSAAQRRFVFVEWYIVNRCHALRDFLERFLHFWIIHE